MLAVRSRIPCGLPYLGRHFRAVVLGRPISAPLCPSTAPSPISLSMTAAMWCGRLISVLIRVEQVYHRLANTLLSPLTVPLPPSAVALSPESSLSASRRISKARPGCSFRRTLLPPWHPAAILSFDLDANLRYDVNLNAPVLSVAFGADDNAIILTRIPVPVDPTNPGPLTNLFRATAVSLFRLSFLSLPFRFKASIYLRRWRSFLRKSAKPLLECRAMGTRLSFWQPRTTIRLRPPNFLFSSITMCERRRHLQKNLSKAHRLDPEASPSTNPP